MSIPLASIQVGRCYLSEHGRIRQVMKFLPDGGVRYQYRSFPVDEQRSWRAGRLDMRRFAESTLREASCNWTPETEEAGQ